jgi:hypothetical protein
MLVRNKLTGSVAILAVAGLMMLSGCSSNNPRDLNIGTDVGVGFVPPDASAGSDADVLVVDTTVEESGNSADSSSVEVSIDESQDEAASDLDASVDGAN